MPAKTSIVHLLKLWPLSCTQLAWRMGPYSFYRIPDKQFRPGATTPTAIFVEATGFALTFTSCTLYTGTRNHDSVYRQAVVGSRDPATLDPLDSPTFLPSGPVFVTCTLATQSKRPVNSGRSSRAQTGAAPGCGRRHAPNSKWVRTVKMARDFSCTYQAEGHESAS